MHKYFISSIVIIFIMLNLGSSIAQIEDRAYLWSLNVGFATNLENPVSGNTMTGGSGSTTLERMIGESNWSLGFNFAFFEASDEFTLNNASIAQGFNSYSLYLGTKYYVRSLGRWTPYIGFGLGVHFSDRYTTGTDFENLEDDKIYSGKENRTNLALSVPVGANYFLSEDVFLGVNLTSVWMDDTFLKSQVNLLVNLALGFHIN
jgi:opacity protein-like surface antigen